MSKLVNPLDEAYRNHLFPSTVPLHPTPWLLRILGKPAWRRMMYVPSEVNASTQNFSMKLIWIYYTR